MFELCIKNAYFWGKEWMKEHAKTKCVPDKVKQARITLFKATAVRKWGQIPVWPRLRWNKELKCFMNQRTGIIGYVSLLIVLTQRKSKLPMTEGTVTTCSYFNLVQELGPSLPRDWRKMGRSGCYLLCWLHFKGMALRSLRQTFLGCRQDKSLLERCRSQRGRERTY